MTNDTGPWGPRDGRPAQPAIPPQARAATLPSAPGRTPSLAANLASTALVAAMLWYFGGWLWAVAGVFGLFVHEFGHVLAMNALGCGPAHIRIIPFLGGAAVPARDPATEFRGVVIALAGPLFGLIATTPFFAAFLILGHPFWLRGAFFVALINLFNLAPAPPLDGSKALGPALAWINPWVEKGAIVLIGGLAAFWLLSRGSILTGSFIGIATLGSLRRGVFRPRARKLTAVEWAASLGLYLAVAAGCVFAIGAILYDIGLPTDPSAVIQALGARR